jgi:hypothetical protein
VLLDVVEAEDLARGCDVQRPVPHRDAVRLRQTAGDRQDLVGVVVTVTIDDRVDLAGILRPDEHGTLRAERHHAGVADVLGEHLDFEAGRNDQRNRRRCALAGGRRQPRGEHSQEESGDKRALVLSHGSNPRRPSVRERQRS